MSSLLELVLASTVGAPIAAAVRSFRHRRWARRAPAPALIAWARDRGFRATDGGDLALIDRLQLVCDVTGRPGDTAGDGWVGPDLGALIGDDITPRSVPAVGMVFAGADGTLVFEVWDAHEAFVYAATPGQSAWVSLDTWGGAARGDGVTAAITRELLDGLAQPARLRAGRGWVAVAAPGRLDVATAALLLERVTAAHAAVVRADRL